MNKRRLELPDINGFGVSFYRESRDHLFEAGAYRPHVNDALEIYVLIEGDVSFSVEASLYELAPGDVIITKPNEIHNCILNSKTPHKHLCFWFDSPNPFFFGSFLKHEFGENNLLRPDEEAKSRLSLIYDEIILASDENDIHKEFYLFLEMLHILKKFSPSSQDGLSPSPIMRDILSDMNKNFKKIRNLDYFTAKYYLSSSTLNRLFNLHLKTTPKAYLEMKKLSFSRMLLMSGKSVTEASVESGFDTPTNFIRTFKRRFGITPKQYSLEQTKTDFI